MNLSQLCGFLSAPCSHPSKLGLLLCNLRLLSLLMAPMPDFSNSVTPLSSGRSFRQLCSHVLCHPTGSMRSVTVGVQLPGSLCCGIVRRTMLASLAVSQ